MKIFIEFEDKDVKKEQLLHLKNYLNKLKIDELEDVQIETTQPKNGEMGLGLLNKLSALIIGTQGPLTKLAEALVKYVENMQTTIKLKNANGEELAITAKMKKDSIDMILEKFFEESENNTEPKKVVKKEEIKKEEVAKKEEKKVEDVKKDIETKK